MNMTLQYIIVGIVIAAVLVRIIVAICKKSKHPTGCCGCPLGENCVSKSKKDNSCCHKEEQR